jgi:hypothetical protein
VDDEQIEEIDFHPRYPIQSAPVERTRQRVAWCCDLRTEVLVPRYNLPFHLATAFVPTPNPLDPFTTDRLDAMMT